jgi:hypothetical protein
MWLLVPFLGVAALAQVSMAVYCLRNYPGAKLPARLLLIGAPLQVLIAAFGDDNLLDGLMTTVSYVVGAAFVCALISVWLASSIRSRRDVE